MDKTLARIPLILAFLFMFLQLGTAHAYRLPKYNISEGDRTFPAEAVLENYREEFSKIKNPMRFSEHGQNSKIRLGPDERKQVAIFNDLNTKISFWERVVKLKDSLVALNGGGNDSALNSEADLIAKTVIEKLYNLSQEYKVTGSALIQNFLINRGIRKKGFCYHYVGELQKALSKCDLKHFELHWGTAWEADFRENNSLVITLKGRPFEEGIAIDAWRTAGKPFWTPVRGDRFPWVEAFEVITPPQSGGLGGYEPPQGWPAHK